MRTIRLLLTMAVASAACAPGGPSDDIPDAQPQDTAAAAGTVPPARRSVKTSHWRCGDLDIATRFDDPSLESLILTHAGKAFTLKAVAADQGARFADADGNQFQSQPGSIRLTLAGGPTLACTKQS